MASKEWNGASGPKVGEAGTATRTDSAAGIAGARRVIQGVIAYLKRAQLRAETARALGTLDERTLKDIGVHPHDVTWLGTRLLRADNDNWRAADNDNRPKRQGTHSAS